MRRKQRVDDGDYGGELHRDGLSAYERGHLSMRITLNFTSFAMIVGHV